MLAGGAGSRLPKCARAASFAESDNAPAGSADIRFETGIVDLFERFARGAHETEEAQLSFHSANRGKLEAPEVEIGIEEGHAVGVNPFVRTDVADDADFCFFVVLRPAKKEFLLGRQLMPGEDASAMQAEKDGLGGLGEHTAVEIAPDQEDGDFLGDAAAPAHNLLGQRGCHKAVAGRPI